MVALTLKNALMGSDPARFGAIEALFIFHDPLLGYHWLYSGAAAVGAVTRVRLSENADMANPETFHIALGNPTYRVSDFFISTEGGQPRLFVSGSDDNKMVSFEIGHEGRLSGQSLVTGFDNTPISQVHYVDLPAFGMMVAGARNYSGLTFFQFDELALTHQDQIVDHAKIAVGNVADIAHISTPTGAFLITGSTNDEGVSSFYVNELGESQFIDTIGTKDGLWLSGLDSVNTVHANGVNYVVIGASGSSSLSLIRINDMGVLFIEDNTYDSLNSRFFRTDAVTTFTVKDRAFIVAGGADDGITLLEILPDHSFFQHDVLVNQAGGALQSIKAIAFTEFAAEIQVIAAGPPGLTLASIDKTSIAIPLLGDAGSNSLTGQEKDDLIWGGAGNDDLKGGPGDDILAGGLGFDRLTGGAGADTFVFMRDQARDEVLDFELGQDRLDIQDWGRIYDVSSIDINETSDGAIISYGDLSAKLISADRQGIEAIDITNDIFLF